MSISCQQCRERLGDLLDAFPHSVPSASAPVAASGAAPSLATEEVSLTDMAHHVESCADCQNDLAILRAARESLRTLPEQAVPLDLRARVLAQIQSETTLATGVSTSNIDNSKQALRSANQSTLKSVSTAWRTFWQRPASVAWAGGVALAAVAVFVMQRDPNASFGTGQQPVNDSVSASAPASKLVDRVPASGQAASAKAAAPRDPSTKFGRKVANPVNGARSKAATEANSETSNIPSPPPQRALETIPRTDAGAPDERSVALAQRDAQTSLPAVSASAAPAARAAITANEQRGKASASHLNDAVPGDNLIRVVWFPVAKPPAVESLSSAVARSVGASTTLSTQAKDESAAAPTRGMIAPRSLGAGDTIRQSQAGVGQATAPGANNAVERSNTNPSLRLDARGPSASSGDGHISPPATVSPPPIESPSAFAGGASAGTRKRALPANKPEPGGRGGGFTSQEDRGERNLDASATRDNSAVSAPAASGPAPAAAAPASEMSLSAPLPKRAQGAMKSRMSAGMAGQTTPPKSGVSPPLPVRRARLSVTAPRDMAQAQIEVAVPPGMRLIDGKTDFLPYSPSRVLWRGQARRGQSIEVEFGIETPTPDSVPSQLDVKLLEVPQAAPLPSKQMGESERVERRIVARRSILVPTRLK